MPASRHFTNDQNPDDVRAQIEADIAAARGSQRDLQAAGQNLYADRMGAAADEALDELNALNRGSWNPKHA
ncbi:hypothetical protein [Streptomyces sp. NPDC059538]|uniref:hypothetical protein n=1 Tax=Streptomyces sp. NPDC059538 TaxID=3346860 RepID=UPI0036AE6B0C